jgi:hypothetical protein
MTFLTLYQLPLLPLLRIDTPKASIPFYPSPTKFNTKSQVPPPPPSHHVGRNLHLPREYRYVQPKHPASLLSAMVHHGPSDPARQTRSPRPRFLKHSVYLRELRRAAYPNCPELTQADKDICHPSSMFWWLSVLGPIICLAILIQCDPRYDPNR